MAATASEAAEVQRVTRGQLVLEDVPEVPAELADRLAQYQNTRWASLADFSHRPEGGVYVRTRFAETAQIHNVAGPGAARQQLTFFPDAVSGVWLCPDARSETLLFTKDAGGNEFYQIYRLDLRTAKWHLLTDGRSKNASVVFDARGTRYAYYSTRRNGKDWDIYVGTCGPEWPDYRAHTLVYQATGSFTPVNFSRDGRQLLLRKYVSATESELHVIDLHEEQPPPPSSSSSYPARPLLSPGMLPPGVTKAQYGSARFSADGHRVYVATDIGRLFRTLTVVDLRAQTLTPLTPDIPWDVESIELSPDGRTLAFTTNEDACSQLYLYDVVSGQRRHLQTPMGTLGGVAFDPRGDRLGFSLSTSAAD